MRQKPIVAAIVLALLAPALALVLPPQVGLCQEKENQQEQNQQEGKTSEQTTRPVVTINLPGEDQRSPYVSCRIELSPADARPGEIVTLAIQTTVVEGWHIYPLASKDGEAGFPTEITFEPSGLVAVDERFTASKKPTVSISKSGAIEKYHEGRFSWSRKYRVAENDGSDDGQGGTGISGAGTIAFQACDASMCVPPKTLAFRLGDAGSPESANDENDNDDANETIVVELEACDATRPKVKLSVAGVLAGAFTGGTGVDRLRLKGTLSFDDQDITVYLPRARKYTIENSETDDTRFSNQATFISVDQNGDGEIAEHESFASNLPVRILDSMFRVTDINKKEKTISFLPIDQPLFGVVLNRRCPDFEFETLDGVTVTNESILGKVTLLDIWAVT